MNDANYYKDSLHNNAMEAIRLIAEGDFDKAIDFLVKATQDQSVVNVLVLQELRKSADESGSNV